MLKLLDIDSHQQDNEYVITVCEMKIEVNIGMSKDWKGEYISMFWISLAQ